MSEPHTVGCTYCRRSEVTSVCCPVCGSRLRPATLQPQGDAWRDRLIRERLNVRKAESPAWKAGY